MSSESGVPGVKFVAPEPSSFITKTSKSADVPIEIVGDALPIQRHRGAAPQQIQPLKVPAEPVSGPNLLAGRRVTLGRGVDDSTRIVLKAKNDEVERAAKSRVEEPCRTHVRQSTVGSDPFDGKLMTFSAQAREFELPIDCQSTCGVAVDYDLITVGVHLVAHRYPRNQHVHRLRSGGVGRVASQRDRQYGEDNPKVFQAGDRVGHGGGAPVD